MNPQSCYTPGVGRMLISLREILHVTPQELGDALGVPAGQVLSDEHAEYDGLSVERARGIIDTLHTLRLARREPG